MNRYKVLQGLLEEIIDNAEIEGDFYGEDITITSSFFHGNVSVFYQSTTRDTFIELDNEDYPDREYKYVREWLERNTERTDMLSELKERIRDFEEEMDEWKSHGFRDAQDYYNYRYH